MPATSKTELSVQQNAHAGAQRILIAGIGYRNLRDLSVGPFIVDRLKKREWPAGIEVTDLSYGPVGVMHNLDERPPYDRMVFVAGVKRNRDPGGVYRYRWSHKLPEAEEIQARMGEAVTGVISLDNLLILATYFKKLPEDVIVIELEPVDENWGEGFTEKVEKAIPEIIAQITNEVNGS